MEIEKEFSSVNAQIEDLHRQLDKECDDAMERDRRTGMEPSAEDAMRLRAALDHFISEHDNRKIHETKLAFGPGSRVRQ